MDTNPIREMQEARSLKQKSISDLKEMCDSFSQARSIIDRYNSEQMDKAAGMENAS